MQRKRQRYNSKLTHTKDLVTYTVQAIFKMFIPAILYFGNPVNLPFPAKTNTLQESVHPKLLANECPARLIKLTVSTVTDF